MSNQSRLRTCVVHNTVLIGAICIGAITQSVYAADGSAKTPTDDWHQTVLIEPFDRALELDLDTAFAVEDAADVTADEWYRSVLFEPFNRSLDGELKGPGTNGGDSAD